MQKQEMKPKLCNLCGCSSEDTAIFTSTYAKGTLNICLACLAEGIVEITKQVNKAVKEAPQVRQEEFDVPFNEMMKLPEEFEVRDEVFGFNCEKCGNVLFANVFPVECNCGHLNTQNVLSSFNNKDMNK